MITPKRKRLISELSDLTLEINKQKNNNAPKEEIESLMRQKRYLEYQISSKKTWDEVLPKAVNFLLNFFGSILGVGMILENGISSIWEIVLIVILVLNFWGYYQIFTKNY